MRPVACNISLRALCVVLRGYLPGLPEDKQRRFRQEIYQFAREHKPALLDSIEEQKAFSPLIESGLKEIMETYFGQEEAVQAEAVEE